MRAESLPRPTSNPSQPSRAKLAPVQTIISWNGSARAGARPHPRPRQARPWARGAQAQNRSKLGKSDPECGSDDKQILSSPGMKRPVERRNASSEEKAKWTPSGHTPKPCQAKPSPSLREVSTARPGLSEHKTTAGHANKAPGRLRLRPCRANHAGPRRSETEATRTQFRRAWPERTQPSPTPS